MRIVIDFQACQSPTSRSRGIGRYSMGLALALAHRNAGRHEIWLALNGCFPDTIDDIRGRFQDALPPERIVVFNVPRRPEGYRGDWRDYAAEAIREHFLADLAPDIIHVSSLFEGLGTEATTGIGGCPAAVTLYDLIPLLRRDVYLTSDIMRRWYYSRIEHLKKAQLWLAISENTRNEAVAALNLPKDQVVNISAAVDGAFAQLTITESWERELRKRYCLNRPFLMYTGAFDVRKNFEGLIEAFSLLPTRQDYQLAIICPAPECERHRLLARAAKAGLGTDEVVIIGFVPEDDLVALYNLCHLFVFPSLHEGFGLPALEAMACGAPVIGSNTSSIPEVIGRKDALFDSTHPERIAEAMARVLSDEGFRRELREHSVRQAQRFSWDESARRALGAFEEHDARTRQASEAVAQVATHDKITHASRQNQEADNSAPVPSTKVRLAYVASFPPDNNDVTNEILPALARYYDITLITDQEGSLFTQANEFSFGTVAWFEQNFDGFDRIIYRFSVQDSHHQILRLLRRHPGVVVLPDVLLRAGACRSDGNGATSDLFRHCLSLTNRYAALLHGQTNQVYGDMRGLYHGLSLDAASGIIIHSNCQTEAAPKEYRALTKDMRTVSQREVERRFITDRHDPGQVAFEYRDAIEAFAANSHHAHYRRLIDSLISDVRASEASDEDLASVAGAISANFSSGRQEQVFIDITGRDLSSISDAVRQLLLEQGVDGPVEPIYWDGKSYRYAVAATCEYLGVQTCGLADEAVEVAAGESVLLLSADTPSHTSALTAVPRSGAGTDFRSTETGPLCNVSIG